jgi:OOP family OmpA-OmpF porin
MKTNLITRSALLTAMLALVGGSALAHDKHSTASHAHPKAGYLVDSRGHVVLDNFGHCWRTGSWTPAAAVAECDPDLV